MQTLQNHLSHLQPTEIDQLWLPNMQATEHAKQTVKFYEEQLDAGAAVSLNSLERAQQTLEQVLKNEQPFQEEFRIRSGWSRVWLGQDSQLHNDCDCAGEKPQLLPFLSGLSEDQVIRRSTTALCLDCFPQAKQHPAWMSARKAEKAMRNCPGSSRKVEDGCCTVCGQQVQLTAKGRAKAHEAASTTV